jgi:carbon-monoxide dehydrogenase small subunit
VTRVELTVNGAPVARDLDPRMSLADFVRDELGLTGTHLGCEHGVCGACTVRLDGESVRSCLVLAAQATGREVTTLEGLAGEEQADRLKERLSARHGLQCGFCTPGVLITALELLRDRPGELSEATVREELGGNLCRCTGYQGIVDAVLDIDQLPREASA